jgi:hypothetical protein
MVVLSDRCSKKLAIRCRQNPRWAEKYENQNTQQHSTGVVSGWETTNVHQMLRQKSRQGRDSLVKALADTKLTKQELLTKKMKPWRRGDWTEWKKPYNKRSKEWFNVGDLAMGSNSADPSRASNSGDSQSENQDADPSSEADFLAFILFNPSAELASATALPELCHVWDSWVRPNVQIHIAVPADAYDKLAAEQGLGGAVEGRSESDMMSMEVMGNFRRLRRRRVYDEDTARDDSSDKFSICPAGSKVNTLRVPEVEAYPPVKLELAMWREAYKQYRHSFNPTTFVIKLDMDTHFNPDALLRASEAFATTTENYIGTKATGRKQEYKEQPYCLGMAYFARASKLAAFTTNPTARGVFPLLDLRGREVVNSDVAVGVVLGEKCQSISASLDTPYSDNFLVHNYFSVSEDGVVLERTLSGSVGFGNSKQTQLSMFAAPPTEMLQAVAVHPIKEVRDHYFLFDDLCSARCDLCLPLYAQPLTFTCLPLYAQPLTFTCSCLCLAATTGETVHALSRPGLTGAAATLAWHAGHPRSTGRRRHVFSLQDLCDEV